MERNQRYSPKMLEPVMTDATKNIDRLPLMGAAERHQVLYGWNDTRTEYPWEKCVHELFEEQVEKTPEATAVVFENCSLSYAELNAKANRLACYLRELGLAAEMCVGIYLQHSL